MVAEKSGVSVWELGRMDLFVGLGDGALAKIKRLCWSDVFAPGEIIFIEGTKATDVYLLVGGQVVLEIRVNGVQQQFTTTIDSINKGHVFGWSALVEPYVLTASARCTQPTRVVRINGNDLLDLFEEYPQIGYMVMKNLSTIVSSRLTAMRLGLQREIRQLLLRDW